MNNIDLEGKYSCTGCGGCKIVCPHNAIEMKISKAGFIVPEIDYEKCTDCGLCTKVCYKYYDLAEDKSKHISEANYFAGWSKNENTRFNSSSGGVTYEVLKWGLENDYKIIGCAYNDEKDMTQHIIIDDYNDLTKIQGSKYIQSDFSLIKDKIKFDEKYIVVGAPCQIHGFKKIVDMRKKTDNFIFIDIFCHGVPSYNIWNQYKAYLKKRNISKINSINFRYKENSWSSYSMRIKDGENVYTNNKQDDPFLRLFLCNSSLNKACYSCELRFNKICADLRMGDFWGDEYKDNKEGVNLIIANNYKANSILKNISNNIHLEEKKFDSIKKSQYHGETLYIPKYKDDINMLIDNNVGIEKIMKKYFDNSITGRIKRKILKSLGFKR